jgi:hypothetical protein
MMSFWELNSEAQKALPRDLGFPIITSMVDKDIAVWMDIVETICAAKQCLVCLMTGSPMEQELNDENRPEATNPLRISWTRNRNDILISNGINNLKSLLVLAELKKTLGGIARAYAGIRPDSTPKFIWDNIKKALRKTITKSSDFAMNNWKSLRLINFGTVQEFTDEFIGLMEVYEATRSDIGESKLNEVDKRNTLMNAIRDSDYNTHRVAWLNETNPEEATVMRYIEILRKDAATDSANHREMGLVANYPKGNFSKNESGRSKNGNGKRKATSRYERGYQVESVPAKIQKGSTNRNYPDRAKDTKAKDQERKKLANRGKSSRVGNTYCEHCKDTRHTIDECWTLHPELRPRKFERGKLLKGSIDYESDGDGRIPYKYDDDERAICLALRDDEIEGKREVKYATQKLADDDAAACILRDSVNMECFMARTIVTKST